MTPTPLVVIGAGGHAKVVIDIVERAGKHRIAGICDDDPAKWGTHVLGHEVLEGIEGFLADGRSRCGDVVIGIGDNQVRRALYHRFREKGFHLITATHPSAVVAGDVAIGEGAVIMAQVAVNPGCRIGACAVINTSASVDHDCVVGECAFIGPGAHLGGDVRVGDLSLIGTGASVVPGRMIGQNATVGAGASVVCDIPENVTVVGVPAREVESALPGQGDDR